MRISDWSSDVCSSDLGAGDEIFGHVAIAPEELQALVHNLVMQVGDRQLDLSRFDWREFALEMARDAPVGKHAKCGRFRRQLRQHELRILEIGNRAAEGLALDRKSTRLNSSH